MNVVPWRMDHPAPRRLPIDELSTLAGVSPRTVRFCIAQGVLDRPEGEKRGAQVQEDGSPATERHELQPLRR
jgi:hypothetical protein